MGEKEEKLKSKGSGLQPTRTASSAGRKGGDEVIFKRPLQDLPLGNPSFPLQNSLPGMDEMEAKEHLASIVEELIRFTPPEFTGTEAPGSPDDVDLSEYPPDAVVQYEHVLEEGRFVPKVPRWAREKLRIMFPEVVVTPVVYTSPSESWEDNPNGCKG